jgi:hypothetical protein
MDMEILRDPWKHSVSVVTPWREWSGSHHAGIVFIGTRTDSMTAREGLMVLEILAPTILDYDQDTHLIEIHAFILPADASAGRTNRETTGYLKILLPANAHLTVYGGTRDATNQSSVSFEAKVNGEPLAKVKASLRNNEVHFEPEHGEITPEIRGIVWKPLANAPGHN